MKPPPPDLRFMRKDTEQYHLCLAAPGIAQSDRRRFAASLLDAILGGSASSRLFQEIREKRGMAYAVYTFASQYTDTGQIGLYVGTREENLGPCLEIAAEQIGEIASGNLRPNELERAKENLKGRSCSMEATSSRMSRLGKSLITDTEMLSLDRTPRRSTPSRPTIWPSSPGSCSRRSASRLRPSGQVKIASSPPSSASIPRSPPPRREVALNGRGGKVGSVLAPALEAAGHDLVELDGR